MSVYRVASNWYGRAYVDVEIDERGAGEHEARIRRRFRKMSYFRSFLNGNFVVIRFLFGDHNFLQSTHQNYSLCFVELVMLSVAF